MDLHRYRDVHFTSISFSPPSIPLIQTAARINLAFSTVSGNAVIIDTRNKFDVRILSMNSAFDCALRKDTSGGDIISYVPAGSTKLRASIPVADGTNVYLDGDSNTTLTYSWTHGP